MFVLKKIVTLLLMPMSLCLGLLGVRILLLWMRRRMGAAKIVLTLGSLVLAALSFSAVADQFIKPLESWYPPLLDTSPHVAAHAGVRAERIEADRRSDRLRGLDLKSPSALQL